MKTGMKINSVVRWGSIVVLFGGIVTISAVYSFSLGQKRAIAAERGAFVATLSAAECLRDGKSEEALNLIENHCYSSALRLIRESGSKRDFTVRALMPRLVRYRRKFARSRDGWTPVEESLERLLGSFRTTNAFLPRSVDKPGSSGANERRMRVAELPVRRSDGRGWPSRRSSAMRSKRQPVSDTSAVATRW